MVVTFFWTLVTISSAFPLEDLQTSATGYDSQPHGQVHIEVHRGPTKKHGYDYYAPFSYIVRQPEDQHTSSHYHGGY
ncbi:hypothetical protein CHUAL_011455 [Chamberlinius hualienensis]